MNKQTETALKMAKQHIIERKGGRGGAVCYVKSDEEVIKAIDEALAQPAQEPVAFNCKNCHACLKGVADERGLPVTLTRMIVCPDCGNKRCPKASNHRHFCTNSNDTDQAGSIYRTHPEPSWRGLSQEEQWNLINKSDIPADYDHEILEIARAIEQALKEKNHG